MAVNFVVTKIVVLKRSLLINILVLYFILTLAVAVLKVL